MKDLELIAVHSIAVVNYLVMLYRTTKSKLLAIDALSRHYVRTAIVLTQFDDVNLNQLNLIHSFC